MKIYDVRGIGASLTGSFSGSFKGLFTGPLDGVAATSSYVQYSNVANKPALVSGSSQVLGFNVFATTGSNGFNGNQSITGSLTVSGQVIAQTLNVQQVTSSIVFSSGSNRFGNNSGNTHSFTGSVRVSGSLTTSIATLGTAATTFLTSDSGTIKSRTAAQTLSDIGAQATGSYVTVATNQSITGQKTFTKNIDVNGVYVGRGASGGDLFAGIAGNTAIGSQALLSISTGYPNTAVGAEALRNITTGANNIAVGSTAGKLISAGTANETSTTSIYIGNDTRPSANGNTNEIVIGHTTTGNGSNTVTIGNSSITNTYLKGAVTLTGALSGTSAVLSSTLSANTTTITNGTRSWIISPSNASINHEFGGVVEGKIDPSSGGNSWFGATSGTTGAGAKHYFSSTGAATFASSVTANSTINGYLGTIAAGQNPATSGTTPVNPMLNLTNNRGVGMYFGGSYAGNYAQWIQVSDTGNLGVNYPLLLNPNGGNVGIGTASPSANLHVVRANDGGSGTPGVILRTDNGANDIVRFQDGTTIVAVVKNDGSIGIGTPTPTNKLHLTGASSTPSLRLGSVTAGYHWDIGRENQSTGDFVFNSTNVSTGTTEKMRITQDSVAYLRMASGTGGIQFNGDTAAANALDDYEEGTWTPTLPNGGTLTVLNARYVKIGQKVTVSFYIQLVYPTNNSSDFLIGGLPFANAGYSTFYTAGSFGYVDTANFSGWAPITGLNFGYIYFHAIDGTSAARKTNANYLAVAGGSNQIILTITYFAAT